MVFLIVEDDDVSSLLLEELLKKLPATILRVNNGRDAIKEIESNPAIQLVFMDIRLPLINGYEATRHIKSIRKDIVVIAQTAYARTCDRERAREAGCDDHLTKPIDRHELVGMLKKHGFS
jgi:CheY-like chemotaxis protein